MAVSFKVPAVFTAVDRLTAPVRNMGTGVMKFARVAENSIHRVDRSFGKLNRRLTSTVALGAGLALAMGARGGATAFMDLDKNMSAAAAKFQIFDRQSSTFIKLRETALKYGATTEFTSGQAAEGLKNLATAGFEANQAIAALPQLLNLATATQQELGSATNVAAKSLAAFGLKSKDPKILAGNLGMVSDTLNKIITTSGFGNLDEFLDVIAQSGSVARSAGVDIKTWGAVVASSVSEAVPASKAGTRFANMLSFMSKNLRNFNKAGIQVADANGNYRDFVDIMRDVEKVTKEMGAVKKASFLIKLFGDRGAKMAQSLLANGIPALEKYRNELKKADGITAKMAEFMRSGLTGGVAAMTSGFQAISIAIGDVFQPEIDNAIRLITEIARGAKDWIGVNKPLIKSVVSLGGMILKAYLGVKLLVGAIWLIRTATIAYNVVLGLSTALQGGSMFALRGNATAMLAMAAATKVATIATSAWAAVTAIGLWPLTLIAAGIAATIALITVVVKKWDSWGAAVTLFMGPLGIVISLVKTFADNWSLIVKSFKSGGIISGIKAVAITIAESLITPIEQLLGIIEKFTGFNLGSSFLKGVRDGMRGSLHSMATGTSQIPTTMSGRPLPIGELPDATFSLPNADAARERNNFERQELVEEKKLKIDINDNSGNATVDESESSGIDVSIERTFSFGM